MTTKAAGKYELVNVADLAPNTWNPNRQSEYIFEHELASIRAFGFTVPVIIREVEGHKEIIDGEHRWRAAQQLNMEKIPAFNLGTVSRETAMQMTVAFNEIKGKPDAYRLGEMLAELTASLGVDAIVQVWPYTPAEIQHLVALTQLPPVTQEDLTKLGASLPAYEARTSLTFAFNAEQVHVVTEALDKALGYRPKSDVDRGLAYELIAADYLSGNDPEIIEQTFAQAVAFIARTYLSSNGAE